MRLRLSAIMASPLTVIYALLLFPVLPVVLYFARQRVHAVTSSIKDRVVAEGRQLRLGLLVIVTGVVSAALVPLYFVAGARLIGAADLPASIDIVLATLFDHLAFFLFLWFLSRSFFSRRSIAEVQFGIPAGAANAFHSSASWLLFGYAVCLLPWLILSRPPFDFVALPRLFYTLFLATFAIGVVSLVRARSPYVQHALGFMSQSLVARHWRTLAGLLMVLAIGIVLRARFWGFDEQALQALDGMRIYSVRVPGAEPEFLTAGDLVRAVVIFIVTFWILRALPGLFEVAVFPRIQMDEGVKYATLTISRYTVFVVGIFLALSAVHLDLRRLGWLMAAIAVGLGFGLQ